MMRKISLTLLFLWCVTHNAHAQGHTSAQSGYIYTPENPMLDWEVEGCIIGCKPIFALKTYLLYDALTALNIEVEVPISTHWSVAGEWLFPWWLNESRQNCFEIHSAILEGRYWFGYHSPLRPMVGWFVNIYGQGGYYDLEWKFDGQQGEFWGGGFGGGYAHRVWCNIRMEYSAAVGVVWTKYRKYDAVNSCLGDIELLREGHFHHNYWGLTKLEVSFVWMFNGLKRE